MPRDQTCKDLSIIIPLSSTETEQRHLLADLKALPAGGMEIIQCCKGSRACSLNKGAAQARGQWLWFIHADSRVSEHNLDALQRSLEQQPDALHYFDLAFDPGEDGSGLSALNAQGANLRSRLFHAPFGDQAFCMHRDIFRRLGGFPENSSYGEDLLLVRRARRADVPLVSTGSTIVSSSRIYSEAGWLQTTALNQLRWLQLLAKDALACRAARAARSKYRNGRV
ncbi:hypothetical protein N9N16_01090 [Porticoccaceae bacterium]|nr:hypothetical protein [Porticoccaceae bacterium]